MPTGRGRDFKVRGMSEQRHSGKLPGEERRVKDKARSKESSGPPRAHSFHEGLSNPFLSWGRRRMPFNTLCDFSWSLVLSDPGLSLSPFPPWLIFLRF